MELLPCPRCHQVPRLILSKGCYGLETNPKCPHCTDEPPWLSLGLLVDSWNHFASFDFSKIKLTYPQWDKQNQSSLPSGDKETENKEV